MKVFQTTSRLYRVEAFSIEFFCLPTSCSIRFSFSLKVPLCISILCVVLGRFLIFLDSVGRRHSPLTIVVHRAFHFDWNRMCTNCPIFNFRPARQTRKNLFWS